MRISRVRRCQRQDVTTCGTAAIMQPPSRHHNHDDLRPDNSPIAATRTKLIPCELRHRHFTIFRRTGLCIARRPGRRSLCLGGRDRSISFAYRRSSLALLGAYQTISLVMSQTVTNEAGLNPSPSGDASDLFFQSGFIFGHVDSWRVLPSSFLVVFLDTTAFCLRHSFRSFCRCPGIP